MSMDSVERGRAFIRSQPKQVRDDVGNLLKHELSCRGCPRIRREPIAVQVAFVAFFLGILAGSAVAMSQPMTRMVDTAVQGPMTNPCTSAD